MGSLPQMPRPLNVQLLMLELVLGRHQLWTSNQQQDQPRTCQNNNSGHCLFLSDLAGLGCNQDLVFLPCSWVVALCPCSWVVVLCPAWRLRLVTVLRGGTVCCGSQLRSREGAEAGMAAPLCGRWRNMRHLAPIHLKGYQDTNSPRTRAVVYPTMSALRDPLPPVRPHVVKDAPLNPHQQLESTRSKA